MRQPRVRLAQQRKAAGYTQEALSYELDVDRTTVTRWEAGETEPQPWIRRKLARVLGVSADQLSALLAGDDSGALVAPIRLNGRVDPESVNQLAAETASIAARYETEPSASLVAEAGQCHAALTFQLRRTSKDHLRRDLHRTATVSATLLGQLVWDASQRRDSAAALSYCNEAIEHATEGGDIVAAAHAELRKAYVALYGLTETRDPRAGLISAQTAAHQAQSVSHSLHGLAQLHVGEALAMLGEYRQCEKALSDAEAMFERMSVGDADSFFSPAQFGRMAGSCYLFLGSPERAEPLLSATVDQLQDRQKTRSLVLGNLALSYLRQRQLDAATQTLHVAIDLLEQSRGGGGMAVVFGAARELYPWRQEPAVQDIHDRLLGLMAQA